MVVRESTVEIPFQDKFIPRNPIEKLNEVLFEAQNLSISAKLSRYDIRGNYLGRNAAGVKSCYSEKDQKILQAVRKAKEIGVRVGFSPKEGAIYFEMPYGQVSFHTTLCEEEIKKSNPSLIVKDNYPWDQKREKDIPETVLEKYYTFSQYLIEKFRENYKKSIKEQLIEFYNTFNN